MKRFSCIALVVAPAPMSTGAFAVEQSGLGRSGEQVDVNAFRNFQKETVPLRDEWRETGLRTNNKETPDRQDRCLPEEMIDLRTKISDAAKKNGLPDRGFGPG